MTRGWGDIGYHFIIDRTGVIYEGRFGGFEVRGAHLYADRTCQNYNLGTVGILLLGDYKNDPVPEVMEDAVARLSAWLATAAGLDPSDLSLKTDVWTNGTDGKKPNGFPRCDLSKGDFSSSYKGPVILTHRDIEKGNSDVQNIDMDAIREEAASLAKTFASLVFKDASKSAYYLLGDRKISTIAKPSSTNKVVTVSSTQLNYFPLAKISLYADGSLLRAIGSKDVFLIQDKQRHHVSSASLFEQLGLKWSDIQDVNREVVLAHKLGDSITFQPGTLIRSLATKRVFYVGAEGRYWIPRESMYGVYGLSPATIIDLTENEVSRYKNKGTLPYPSGTVVQALSGTGVYVVRNGSLHTIEIADPFKALKLDKNKVVFLPTQELATYTHGISIMKPDEYQNLLASAEPSIVQTATLTASALPVIKKVVKKETTAIETPKTTTPPTTEGVTKATEPTIRIAICWERNKDRCAIPKGQVLSVRSPSAYSVNDNGAATAKNANEVVDLTYRETGVVRFEPQGLGDLRRVEIMNYNDRSTWNPDLNDNVFRGVIELHFGTDGAYIINELPLEQYLQGIAEVVNDDVDGYKKVLITASRTYAYGYLTDTENQRHPGKPFTLMNLSNDQLYRGYNYEARSKGLIEAVQATRGSIILYNSKPIVAAYSSDSGGVSKAACTVFAGRYCEIGFEYLKGGIKDPTTTTHVQSKVAASHGVGMSTQGARAMIASGSTYDEVILYYYPGVTLEQLYQ